MLLMRKPKTDKAVAQHKAPHTCTTIFTNFCHLMIGLKAGDPLSGHKK